MTPPSEGFKAETGVPGGRCAHSVPARLCPLLWPEKPSGSSVLELEGAGAATASFQLLVAALSMAAGSEPDLEGPL